MATRSLRHERLDKSLHKKRKTKRQVYGDSTTRLPVRVRKSQKVSDGNKCHRKTGISPILKDTGKPIRRTGTQKADKNRKSKTNQKRNKVKKWDDNPMSPNWLGWNWDTWLYSGPAYS